jgi:hypothetical protein
LAPTAYQEGLTREINIHFRELNQSTYCLLASGTNIEKLATDSYAISNKSYYWKTWKQVAPPQISATATALRSYCCRYM